MDTQSVTLTITSKDGFFQAKVEKNGYFDLDVTRILNRAVKEAVNFGSAEEDELSDEEDEEQEKEQAKTTLASEDELSSDEEEEVEAKPTKTMRYVGRKVPGCRDPKRCFVNGQKIRHKCRGSEGWWTGIYHDGGIWYKKEYFEADDSISQFARAHYYSSGLNPSSPPPVYSYWDECECEVDGQWISTYNLRPRI